MIRKQTSDSPIFVKLSLIYVYLNCKRSSTNNFSNVEAIANGTSSIFASRIANLDLFMFYDKKTDESCKCIEK